LIETLVRWPLPAAISRQSRRTAATLSSSRTARNFPGGGAPFAAVSSDHAIPRTLPIASPSGDTTLASSGSVPSAPPTTSSMPSSISHAARTSPCVAAGRRCAFAAFGGAASATTGDPASGVMR
jgi:hypothetical protein